MPLRPSTKLIVIRLKQDKELEEKLEEAGLDVMDYKSRSGRYRIRLQKNDIKKNSELLTKLLKMSWE